MPAFCLDLGTPDAARMFASLPAFTQGYIEAMFFTDTSTGDDAERGLEAATISDLAPEFLARIRHHCTLFEARHEPLLEEAYSLPRRDPYGPTEAGRDFWYTRNGHGTGFWDRNLGLVGDKLADLARRHSCVDIYRGDDGRIWG